MAETLKPCPFTTDLAPGVKCRLPANHDGMHHPERRVGKADRRRGPEGAEREDVGQLADLMAAIRKKDHQATLMALTDIFVGLHGEHEHRDQVVLSALAVVDQAARSGNDPHPATVENALNLLRGWIGKRLRAPAEGTGEAREVARAARTQGERDDG